MELKMGYRMPEQYSFKYKPGARHRVDAEIVGRVCSELDDEDRLTPENLLDVSRPEDAPVHREFEWDDDIAAEKYRVSQAAALIRHVVIYEKQPEEPDDKAKQVVMTDGGWNGTRAFNSLHTQNGEKRRYVATHKMLDDDEMREILLGNARRELNAFVAKYRRLTELADLLQDASENLVSERERQMQALCASA